MRLHQLFMMMLVCLFFLFAAYFCWSLHLYLDGMLGSLKWVLEEQKHYQHLAPWTWGGGAQIGP